MAAIAFKRMKFAPAPTIASVVLKNGNVLPNKPALISQPVIVRVIALTINAIIAAFDPRRTPTRTAKPNSHAGPPLKGPTKIITSNPMHRLSAKLLPRVLHILDDATRGG